MSESIKFVYDNIKITVRERYNKWYLDFTYNKKRIKRTTSLIVSDKNINELKTKIIPELIVALTGNKEIEYFKKDILLNYFSIKYFNVYKQIVRDCVAARNEKHYNNHIKPYFGELDLKSIAPLQLEESQNILLSNYKASSVSKYRSVLYSIFEKALSNRLIEFNPLSRVKSPLSIKKKFKKLDEKEEDDINPFNNKGVIEILKNAKGNLYYFIIVMLYTGIKPGELISLHWKDVDYIKKE
ncbi:MAG: hypothetical protein CL624_07785 [Arcobacter sp.]|nr:hypothetical protein [Arcobacter sp.]|tara:strand:- start:4451 stop:5173 length:723 start_codon:yes stop_codon:yes gene_type:complete